MPDFFVQPDIAWGQQDLQSSYPKGNFEITKFAEFFGLVF